MGPYVFLGKFILKTIENTAITLYARELVRANAPRIAVSAAERALANDQPEAIRQVLLAVVENLGEVAPPRAADMIMPPMWARDP